VTVPDSRFLAAACLLLAALAGCEPGHDAGRETSDPGKFAGDPLAGAWELVHARYGLPDAPVEFDQPDAPLQLKIFGAGRYAHVMNGPDGEFWGASAGTYAVDGDRYTETTLWTSSPKNIGSVTTFAFRIEGDLLLMEGPLEIVDAEGNRVERFPRMEEVRRRAK